MIFFVLFSVLAFILIFFLMIRILIRLGSVALGIVDVLIIGGLAVYYAHHKWFVYIASGKAVYFWDVLLFIVIAILYSSIISMGTSSFPKLAALFHYAIAWFITYFIYGLANHAVFGEMAPLLNHQTMNEIVHVIIVTLLAFIIFKRRMRIFNQEIDSY